MNTNIFEQASREKLRFNTIKGSLSVEDLWELPLTHATKANLDDLAKDLYKEVKAQDTEVSFVTKKAAGNSVLTLAFEIVKYVIDVRLAEAEVAEKAKASKARRQQILQLIEAKENEQMSTKSVDELRSLLDQI